MKKSISYIFIISLFTFYSCKPTHFYNDFKTVDVKGWKSSDTLRYAVDMDDSNANYDILVSIRHQKTYEFSNLWMNVITEYGDGKKTFRFEIPLFKDDGKPYGKNSGSLCTQTIPFQKQIRFPVRGKYKIAIVQLMRKDPLDGISDVGVIIDKK